MWRRGGGSLERGGGTPYTFEQKGGGGGSGLMRVWLRLSNFPRYICKLIKLYVRLALPATGCQLLVEHM